uniref:TolC family protein n=1 Tax=Sphingomonas sp. H160509 TaxID=2955313 RepID=UPI0020969C68|nr:TolC family protein [Sphingomonas sp. H160509]
MSAAEADILSGRERLREVENFILLEVVDSYVSVRRDAAIVGIQERSVQSYERQAAQARARERGGDLTRTDIAQAEAQLLIIRSSLAQARASLEQSRARFTTVVGRTPGVLDVEAPLPGLPPTIDAAYRTADAESPSLWQTILNERAGRQRVAAARAERAPTISLQGSYGYISPVTYQTRDLGRAVSGAVNFSMPLLSSGVIGSRVRAATAQAQQLGFQIEDTRRQVNQAVLTSWNQTITAQEQLDVGRAASIAAQSALEGVRRGFAEGFRSNFEVLDSEQRLLNAQLIVANAEYNHYAGQANLLAYLGRLQAAALTNVPAAYDPAKNLERQRRSQIGPFQLILQPLDKLQKPNGDTRAAPGLPAPRHAAVCAGDSRTSARGAGDVLSRRSQRTGTDRRYGAARRPSVMLRFDRKRGRRSVNYSCQSDDRCSTLASA